MSDFDSEFMRQYFERFWELYDQALEEMFANWKPQGLTSLFPGREEGPGWNRDLPS